VLQAGGHTIKVIAFRGGNDILEDKFQALVNINVNALNIQVHLLPPLKTLVIDYFHHS